MNAKVAVFYFLNFLSLSFYEQQNGKDILINIIGDVIMGEVGKRRKKGTMKEYQSGNTARKSRSEWQRELMSSKVRKSEENRIPSRIWSLASSASVVILLAKVNL
jgi:hypothetical protein